MSTRNISISIYWTLAVLLAVDMYIYAALRKSLKQFKWSRLLNSIYLICVLLGYTGFYFLFDYFTTKPLHPLWAGNLAIGFFFSFMLFKILLLIFFFMEDLVRFSAYVIAVFRKFAGPKNEKIKPDGRRSFVRKAGLIVAAIPFSSMLYGITKGKYNFQVNRVKLAFEHLPKAFEGFKITHISDIHSGSFDNKEAVLEGIDLINQQEGDLILFTGDLVNNDSREIIPFIDDFKRLNAPYGKYSVLGNHDYGDYKKWDSKEAKQENLHLLFKLQNDLGFNLLNNEHVVLTKDGESIGIYGVENWGNPPFPQKGDLDLALMGAENRKFKILMSHDPTHWDKKVIDHPVHIDLTLSGHTHGMQFGIEIPGFKWSPIKYIYKQWAGLYEKKHQYLYVNRGFGFLGFPGRVGIWPEITSIELTRKTGI